MFDAGQPDFNWEHPDVQQHFDDVLTFWLDRGVEGFRVDAVTVVGKTPGLPEGPTPPPGLPRWIVFRPSIQAVSRSPFARPTFRVSLR